MPLFRYPFLLVVLLFISYPTFIACFVRSTNVNARRLFLSLPARGLVSPQHYQKFLFLSAAADHGWSGQSYRRRFSTVVTPILKLIKWFRSVLLTTVVAWCFFLMARGPAMAHAVSGGSFSGSSFQQTTSSSSGRQQRSDTSRRYVGSSSSSSSTSFYFGRPSSSPSSSPRYSNTAHGMMLRPESSVVRTAPMSVLAQLITIISVTMFLLPRLKSTAMAQVIW